MTTSPLLLELRATEPVTMCLCIMYVCSSKKRKKKRFFLLRGKPFYLQITKGNGLKLILWLRLQIIGNFSVSRNDSGKQIIKN